VCINVERPACQQKLDVVCQIRKAVAFEVTLTNPMKETALYEISIEGDGLIGDQFFQLEPGQTGNYEIIFSPCRVGAQKGQVSIINEKLGEVWYELRLIAEACPPQRLPLFKADLGKFVTRMVTLDNNSGQAVDVRSTVTNSLNFALSPEKVQIPPFSATTVQIRYTPTNLDVLEQGEILLQTDAIGDWKFELQGQGLVPQAFEPTQISS